MKADKEKVKAGIAGEIKSKKKKRVKGKGKKASFRRAHGKRKHSGTPEPAPREDAASIPASPAVEAVPRLGSVINSNPGCTK